METKLLNAQKLIEYRFPECFALKSRFFSIPHCEPLRRCIYQNKTFDSISLGKINAILLK